MFNSIEVIKIVKELSNSEGVREKLKLIFLLFLLAVIFLLLRFIIVNKVIAFIPFITDPSKYSSADEVFVYLALIILSFVFASLLFWGLSFAYRNIHKFWYLLNDYSWNKSYGLRDWDFQGNVVIDEKQDAIHVINSNLGLILKNRRWKDYEMTFKFKMLSNPVLSPKDEQNNQLRRGFGVIYRAKNLGEYYMLKIDASGYSPHVRNVLWENNGPIFHTALTKSDLNKWIGAKLIMKDKCLTVELGKDKFDFFIPTHSNVSTSKEIDENNNFKNIPYSKIPFRNEGTVGFRSSGCEEVYIKDLLVIHKFNFNYDLIKIIKKYIYSLVLIRFGKINL